VLAGPGAGAESPRGRLRGRPARGRPVPASREALDGRAFRALGPIIRSYPALARKPSSHSECDVGCGLTRPPPTIRLLAVTGKPELVGSTTWAARLWDRPLHTRTFAPVPALLSAGRPDAAAAEPGRARPIRCKPIDPWAVRPRSCFEAGEFWPSRRGDGGRGRIDSNRVELRGRRMVARVCHRGERLGVVGPEASVDESGRCGSPRDLEGIRRSRPLYDDLLAPTARAAAHSSSEAVASRTSDLPSMKRSWTSAMNVGDRPATLVP